MAPQAPGYPPRAVGSTVPWYGTSLPPPLSPLDIWGSTVRQWFDYRFGAGVGYTLNGANLSAGLDLSGNAFDEVQGNVAFQPALLAADGPGGTPAVVPQGLSRRLVRAGSILAAGGQPTIYTLCRLPTANPSVMWSVRAGFITMYKTTAFQWYVDYQTIADATAVVVTPAFDVNYHLHKIAYSLPTTTVAIDGVLVAPQPAVGDFAPDMVNTTTGDAIASRGGLACKLTLSVVPTQAQEFMWHDWLNRSVVNGLTFGLNLPTS